MIEKQTTADKLLYELSVLWHISRTACASVPVDIKQYKRRLWIAKEFAKAHPEFTEMAAYKAVDRMTVLLPLSNDMAVLELFNRVLERYQGMN